MPSRLLYYFVSALRCDASAMLALHTWQVRCLSGEARKIYWQKYHTRGACLRHMPPREVRAALLSLLRNIMARGLSHDARR